MRFAICSRGRAVTDDDALKPVAEVSAVQARRVLMARQGLAADPDRRIDRAGLLAAIEALGFVQVDSIRTVARAHDMIMFSRATRHDPSDLRGLIEQDRALFENWTHDAALIPTRYYPYLQRRFVRLAGGLERRWNKWQNNGFQHELDVVLERIRQDGPVAARNLRGDGGQKRADGNGGWWDWHPSKTALEYLWRTGALAVCHREGFQKVYDLTERVVPAVHRGGPVPEDEFIDWACRRALERLGFATHGELAAFWGMVSPAEAKAWCLGPGREFPRVVVGAVDGSAPRTMLADPTALETDPDDIAVPPRLRALSPFDPVIRDRSRTKRLFGFDYRIEIFVPAERRTYGYYVFPLMEGDRLVGRIDMKRAPESGCLQVDALWWEPGIRPGKGRLARLESELERVARFAQCEDVAWRRAP